MARRNRVKVPMNSFFRTDGSSIQRAYQFLVDFNMYSSGQSINAASNFQPADVENSSLRVFGSLGEDHPIKEYHVRSVVLPQYNFKKETQRVGTFTKIFPVFDNEGIELKIELKEDEDHNVGQFITYLQKRIINEDGIYVNPAAAMINDINVLVLNNRGEKVARYIFKECFYMNTAEPNYAYDSNALVSYVITFGANYYELELFSRGARNRIPNTSQTIDGDSDFGNA